MGESASARIGLISDTHGELDGRVEEIFRGVDAIIHAGDVCSAEILHELELIAPVTAVAGNCDARSPLARHLPYMARLNIAGTIFAVIHDLTDLLPVPDDVDVVVSGHTHRPRSEWHGRTLVLNPGSATQPRGGLPRSVGIVEVDGTSPPAFSLVEFGDHT